MSTKVLSKVSGRISFMEVKRIGYTDVLTLKILNGGLYPITCRFLNHDVCKLSQDLRIADVVEIEGVIRNEYLIIAQKYNKLV